MRLRILSVFFIFFLFNLFNCSTYYNFSGIITVKNNTDFDVKVDIYFEKKTYYQDNTVKESDKHASLIIASFDDKTVSIIWAETFKSLNNEIVSDDVHIIAVKLDEPAKIILDKDYHIMDQRKLTVWIEETL